MVFALRPLGSSLLPLWGQRRSELEAGLLNSTVADSPPVINWRTDAVGSLAESSVKIAQGSIGLSMAAFCSQAYPDEGIMSSTEDPTPRASCATPDGFDRIGGACDNTTGRSGGQASMEQGAWQSGTSRGRRVSPAA